jgi:hypothetical protein
MRIFLFVFLLVGINDSVYSQKSEIGNWFIYFGNQKINKNWNWHNEIQYRNYDFIGDTNQLLLRTGIGYNLTENNNNVLLGYAFVNTQKYIPNSDQKQESNEHRIFQQFITKQNFGRFYFLHRYRIEERFLTDDFQMRLRYFLNLNIPLNKKTLDKNAIYLSTYNEIFVNTENPLFDRNRVYAALGFVINKNFKVEAGFMSQILEQSNRNQFQIVIFNNLPFKN